MNRPLLTSLLVILALSFLAGGVQADDQQTTPAPAPTTVPSDEDMASKVTDPSSVLAQLQFFYTKSFDQDTDQTTDTLLMQPVLPMTKRNVFRPALPVTRTTGVTSNETGIGDLFMLDVFLFDLSHGSWGVGPVASLPIASDDAFGTGKVSVGPMAMYIYKGLPKTIFGFLGMSIPGFILAWLIGKSYHRLKNEGGSKLLIKIIYWNLPSTIWAGPHLPRTAG